MNVGRSVVEGGGDVGLGLLLKTTGNVTPFEFVVSQVVTPGAVEGKAGPALMVIVSNITLPCESVVLKVVGPVRKPKVVF